MKGGWIHCSEELRKVSEPRSIVEGCGLLAMS